MDFGFIIIRHVNSEKTNKYWNQSVKLLRVLYPERKIVIIDDNSDPEFINPFFDYKNVTIIESEYHGRGELLPFYYYLKYKWFDNAVIIHDSVFIHKRLPFEKLTMPVIPLWHFDYDKENFEKMTHMIYKGLRKPHKLDPLIHGNQVHVLGMSKPDVYGCFGVMCYINYYFLKSIENTHNITNLVNYVHCRTDRCVLERIFGILFASNYPQLTKYPSLFGNIQKKGIWGYTYEQYESDFNNKQIKNPVVKVWTGR